MKIIARDRVSQALAEQDLTFADLMAITGLTKSGLATGIYELRRRGRITCRPLPGHMGPGRPTVIYTIASAQ